MDETSDIPVDESSETAVDEIEDFMAPDVDSVPSTGDTGKIPLQRDPIVGVIMGSKSDLPTMEACMEQLEQFNIPYEMKVASAHRCPEAVHEWASNAASRGMRVIIAGAGKAAHLAGVAAACTPLPVIGVPMKTSDLGGMDSLLSMVQMPSGVPVACVAINGAKNAAILATQIIGAGTQAIDCSGAFCAPVDPDAQKARQAIVDFKAEMAADR